MKKKLREALWHLLLIPLPLAVVLVLLLGVRHCAGTPERLTYRQDARTGLCFAYTFWQGPAHVPCHKVRKLLE
jgi:hypothetical protein